MSKSRVFVVQEPGKINILPARDFGEIEVLLLNTDVDMGLDHCVRVLREKLQSFTDDDYLVLIGDPILIALTAHVALESNDSCANMLRWNRGTYRYNIEHITL